MARPQERYTVETNKKGLRKRAAPSYDAEILAIIPNGEIVKINSRAKVPKGWAALQGGGFVAREYLK